MNNPETENNPVDISKSQRKREALEWLNLAKKIVALPASRCQFLALDDELREAIEFARSIRKHGAHKRQLQTIAKMLRKRDAQPLAQAMDQFDQHQRRLNARHHLLEAWRDRLLAGTDDDLATLLQHCPDINTQTLRQLIRSANKEVQAGKAPVAARKLFKLLRETSERTPLPPLPPD